MSISYSLSLMSLMAFNKVIKLLFWASSCPQAVLNTQWPSQLDTKYFTLSTPSEISTYAVVYFAKKKYIFQNKKKQTLCYAPAGICTCNLSYWYSSSWGHLPTKFWWNDWKEQHHFWKFYLMILLFALHYKRERPPSLIMISRLHSNIVTDSSHPKELTV